LQQYETGEGNYTLERDEWLAEPKIDDSGEGGIWQKGEE